MPPLLDLFKMFQGTKDTNDSILSRDGIGALSTPALGLSGNTPDEIRANRVPTEEDSRQVLEMLMMIKEIGDHFKQDTRSLYKVGSQP